MTGAAPVRPSARTRRPRGFTVIEAMAGVLAIYAPEDEVVHAAVADGGCFDDPYQYCTTANICSPLGDIPAWSSYALSPAAMFDPKVMAHNDVNDPEYNGFRDPWSLDDGLRSPAISQALYPHLKSHMLEHHWLHGAPADPCNPGFEPGTYGDDCCEPYYFNHGFDSRPNVLFYDGHIGSIGVRDAIADDERFREQSGDDEWGLWSKDTYWGRDGYLSEYGYDQAQTSFHILTTDGIRGRDVLLPAGLRPAPTNVPRPTLGRSRPAPRPVTDVHGRVTLSR